MVFLNILWNALTPQRIKLTICSFDSMFPLSVQPKLKTILKLHDCFISDVRRCKDGQWLGGWLPRGWSYNGEGLLPARLPSIVLKYLHMFWYDLFLLNDGTEFCAQFYWAQRTMWYDRFGASKLNSIGVKGSG